MEEPPGVTRAVAKPSKTVGISIGGGLACSRGDCGGRIGDLLASGGSRGALPDPKWVPTVPIGAKHVVFQCQSVPKYTKSDTKVAKRFANSFANVRFDLSIMRTLDISETDSISVRSKANCSRSHEMETPHASIAHDRCGRAIPFRGRRQWPQASRNPPTPGSGVWGGRRGWGQRQCLRGYMWGGAGGGCVWQTCQRGVSISRARAVPLQKWKFKPFLKEELGFRGPWEVAQLPFWSPGDTTSASETGSEIARGPLGAFWDENRSEKW